MIDIDKITNDIAAGNNDRNEHRVINPVISILPSDINRDEAIAGAKTAAEDLAEQHNVAPDDVEYLVRVGIELSTRYIDQLGSMNTANHSINSIFAAINEIVDEVRQEHPDIPLRAYEAMVPSITASAVNFWYRSVGAFHEALTDREGSARIYSGRSIHGGDIKDLTDEEFDERLAMGRDRVEPIGKRMDPKTREAADYVAEHYGRALRKLKQQRSFAGMTAGAVAQWSDRTVHELRERWVAEGHEVNDSEWTVMEASAASALIDMWHDEKINELDKV